MSSEPSTSSNVTTYEKRAVAFLDILGFTDLIKEQGHESEILAVFEHLRFRASQVERASKTGGMQFTAFSDCIVLSAELRDGFGAFRMAAYVGYLVLDLLARGFLVRGGLTVGDLYHKNGMVFGPAMIDAYALESKNAIYPRIAVLDAFRDEACKGAVAMSNGDAAHARVQGEYLQYRRDFDGVLHLDVFNPLIPSPESLIKAVNGQLITRDDKGRAVIDAVRKTRALRYKPGVAQKYDWMENYLQDCITRFNWQHLL